MSDNLLQSLSTLSEPLKTSFGPNGNDHLIISGKTSTITNDGATILSLLKKRSVKKSNNSENTQNSVLSNLASHPMLDLLIKCSKTQEKIAGDGTTSVVLLIGALAEKMKYLKEIYPRNLLLEGLEIIRKEIDNFSFTKIDLNNEEILEKIVTTSLSSKILNYVSEEISKVAIAAVKKSNKEFERIKIHKMFGSIEDMALIEGFLINSRDSKIFEKFDKKTMKTAFIQFCLSPPKPALDATVYVDKSNLIDQLIKEERAYIKNMVRKIKEAGIEMLFIQKSLTKESVSDLAEYYLKKGGISFCIVDREEFEGLAYELKAKKSQSTEYLDTYLLDFTYEEISGKERLILKKDNLLSLVVCGTDKHIRDEAERSLHDAMSVIRCLLEDPHICYGGGHFELSFADFLRKKIKKEKIFNPCVDKLLEGIEQLPYYLAINSGYSYNLIEDLKLSLLTENKLGVRPNLQANYNEFLISFDKESKKNISEGNETENHKNKISHDLELRQELINEKLKCFDVTEIIVPKKVVKSQIVLACELLEVVGRIDEVLPAK